jgi:hypothetical protein
MPLTPKGRKILRQMQEEYGAAKGEAVFYASRNKGRITGVDLPEARVARKRGRRRETLP